MRATKRFIWEHPVAIGLGLVFTSLAVLVLAIVFALRGTAPDEAARASATPSSTATAPTTPSAEPAASEAPPSPSPSPSGGYYQLRDIGTPLFGGVWARVIVDSLNVRQEPGTRAAVVGVLQRNDLVRISGDGVGDDRGYQWWPMVGDGVGGFIAESDGEDLFLQPVATPWLYGPRRVLNGVAASNGRFIAYGWASDLDVLPYEGSGTRAVTYLTGDGQEWTELPNSAGNVTVAGGDGGFVRVDRPAYLEPTFVRISTDGEQWTDVATLDAHEVVPAWGPADPVLGIRDEAGWALFGVTSDGLANEFRLPPDVSSLRIETSARAYVAMDGSIGRLYASTDGRTWAASEVPDLAGQLLRDVELVGDRLIVVETDGETGRTTLRYGQLSGDSPEITWTDEVVRPFGDVTIDRVSAGGGMLLALGWSSDELVPRVWRSADGVSWRDLGVAAGTFGGAIGPEPEFTAGRWMAATDAVYASADGSVWEPVFALPADPPQGPGCPPANEVRALDLVLLGHLAADCYGDTELTFTAWALVVDGLGGCCPPRMLPEWLAGWIAPVHLSSGPGGETWSAVLAPTLSAGPDEEGWVRLTGHFRDPASEDCVSIPLAGLPQRLESRASAVDRCAGRFVIDNWGSVGAP